MNISLNPWYTINILNKKFSDIFYVLNTVNGYGCLADLVASNLRMKSSEAQRILESLDPIERLGLVNAQLANEVEVAAMQAKIQSMAKEGMDKAQREYFLREQLKAIRRELGDKGGESEEFEELRSALNSIGLPKKVRKEADKQLSRLESMHPDSSESTILHRRSEERRVGKECRSRWSPYH